MFSVLYSHHASGQTHQQELVKELGGSGVEAVLPFDFLIFTPKGPVPIERKEFPSDFLASVQDGRLSKECDAMREWGDFRFLILEAGELHYSLDGYLLDGRIETSWTETAVRNMIRSLKFVKGVDVEWTGGIPGTVARLQEIHSWFEREHLGLNRRPKMRGSWWADDYDSRLVNFYQGLPRVSVVRAQELAKVYKTPAELMQASMKDLRQVPGFGKVISTGVWEFLHGKKSVHRELKM